MLRRDMTLSCSPGQPEQVQPRPIREQLVGREVMKSPCHLQRERRHQNPCSHSNGNLASLTKIMQHFDLRCMLITTLSRQNYVPRELFGVLNYVCPKTYFVRDYVLLNVLQIRSSSAYFLPFINL